MEKETGIKIQSLVVDGGVTDNKFLMQFQSDILDLPIIKPRMVETTSLGAAFLAGLKSGLWNSVAEIKELNLPSKRYDAKMENDIRQRLFKGWQKALRQARAK
jgi:glycerol kinase